MRFRDRADAGRKLVEHLRSSNLVDPVVLGLPRGGVPVAAEIAAALDAPLEVFVARKIGMPGHVEYGLGAIAEGGGLVINNDAAGALRISHDDFSHDDFAALVEEERGELERRVSRYRGGRALPDVCGRDVILVDDGLATGVTAEAALKALRTKGPQRLVLAVPVAAADTVTRLAAFADGIVCVLVPPHFRAVGSWYDDFDQTTDDEVLRLLSTYGSGRTFGGPGPSGRDADGPQRRGEPHA